MDFRALPERLAHVRAEIARRQQAGGWTHPVTLVAVTKGFGLDAVEAALAAGLTELGENRVQEALEKIDTPAGARATWHLIGHLQRNKAKQVPGRFAHVHSVDSTVLALELEQRAAERGVTQRVLAVYERRIRPAPHVSQLARPARRLAGGGSMATGALDGDVRRLRRGARGGSDDAPLGDGPVRAEVGVSEDAFHLTPLDIRKQEFRRALRGYEPAGVEDFRARVADELERISRERALLEERLAALTDQLRAFRERERAMNEALVAAQELRQDTRAAAEREAQVIVREAQAEARRIADEARTAEGDVRRQLAEAERQFQAYLGGFRALLERQMAELRALDGPREG